MITVKDLDIDPLKWVTFGLNDGWGLEVYRGAEGSDLIANVITPDGGRFAYGWSSPAALLMKVRADRPVLRPSIDVDSGEGKMVIDKPIVRERQGTLWGEEGDILFAQ